MTDLDPDQLQAWRTEIAEETADAEKELVAAEVSLTEAREALRIASATRQASYDATGSLRSPVAYSLASRLDTFFRAEKAATGRVLFVEQVVANVRHKLSDLQLAVTQLDRLGSGVSEPEPEPTGIIRG